METLKSGVQVIIALNLCYVIKFQCFMRSVLTSALLCLVVKLSDHGSRPMEQEEKENNNLETRRKRLGQDTDGKIMFKKKMFKS